MSKRKDMLEVLISAITKQMLRHPSDFCLQTRWRKALEWAKSEVEKTSKSAGKTPSESTDPKTCKHENKRSVGVTCVGMGDVTVYWCPNCGALKRTMTNWAYTDYPWILPDAKAVRQEKLEP